MDGTPYKRELVIQAFKKWTDQLTNELGVKLYIDLEAEFSSGGIFSAEFPQINSGSTIDMDSLMRDIQLKNEVAAIV